ncbi:MAG: NAD(P)-dependent oxidoreductase [Candidatus Latescibacteria bacterium]|jgi:nucleoside-diphosphate-sugar epimerase|nr:NAD(P)-dependent oxidoreductase [Candidatus Latescibacterota bacterium]MBT4137871.1 NAD(P)-dependent oxidoreductase [Candidatus Latescibacterota bacterium]MBT5831450.1 NAD(P)-dependent oxidoreductase [Candidatus Latescibacterota bacterium]
MQQIQTEPQLIDQMTTPSEAVKDAVSKLDGDIMILGIAGKMGPTLGELLARAGANKVIGVSRFSNPADQQDLNARGITTHKCDLLDETALNALPDAPYIYLMAGHKFGATGNEPLTWAMNTMLPGKILQRFPKSRIVYVSSGNVYKYTSITSSGATESDPVEPIGEYAMSRLGGERLAEFYSKQQSTPLSIVRLFYATELRYGILIDIAQKIHDQTPIDLAMGHVNQIWQGDANAYLAQMFPLCESPANIINMTGKEVLPIRELATSLGERMGINPIFEGTESDNALLGDANKMFNHFGLPQNPIDTIVDWVAHWMKSGGPTLGKPTKYESRTGKF